MKKQLLFLFITLILQRGLTQNYLVSTIVGNGVAGYVSGLGTSCELNIPADVQYNGDSLLYFVEVSNHCIRKLNLVSNQVTTIAGNGMSGYVDGIGTAARFYSPNSILYKNHRLYITEAGNHDLRMIDLNNNNTVTTIAGSGIGGFQNGSVTAAKFNNPYGTYVENNGDILVADYGNHCIRLISNGQVTTWAGTPTVAGLVNGPLLSSKFNKPMRIIKDSLGNYYITDLVNNVIRKISTNNVSTFSGTGAQGAADGSATTCSYNIPCGIVQVNSGHFYLMDAGNSKIRKLDSLGNVVSVAGSGIAGFQDGLGSLAKFNGPNGVTFDSHGNIYIADAANNRIRKLIVPEAALIPVVNIIGETNLYPNPGNGVITIKVKTSNADKIIYEVTDEIGKVIKKGKVSAHQIDLSELNNGIYFLDIIPEQGIIERKKIIIAR